MLEKRGNIAELALCTNRHLVSNARFPKKIFGVMSKKEDVMNEIEERNNLHSIEQIGKRTTGQLYNQLQRQKQQKDVVGQHLSLTHGFTQQTYTVEPFDFIHSNIRGYLHSALGSTFGPGIEVDVGINGLEVINKALRRKKESHQLYAFCISYDHTASYLMHDIEVVNINNVNR